MAIEVDGYDSIVEVARGGFGVVYRARHVRFDRTVALKVLSQLHADDDATRRWERECRAMGALSWHPNIVVVYDLGATVDSHPFLSMEYLDRGSLADRIVQQGPLPWQDAVTMTIQVAGALQAAHDAGVLHRDLKPENILVGLYGEAKLTDFGLATGENMVQTATGLASFTLAHASPEALMGERVTVSGDIYSLGSTLYHLLAGRPPFVRATDENVLAAVQRVINEPVPDLRQLGVPAPVALVVETAMAKDPTARPASPAELGRALQQAQQTLGVPITNLRLDPRGADVTMPTSVLPAPPGGEESGATVHVAPDDLAEPAAGAPPVPPVEPVIPPLPPMPPREAAPVDVAAPPAAPPAGAPPGPAVPAAAPAPAAASYAAGGPGSSAPATAAGVGGPGAPGAGGVPAATPGGPMAPETKRSKLPLLVGLAVVVVLVLVGAFVVLSGGDGNGGDNNAGGGNGGAGADGEVGTVVATIPVGTTPRGVAVADGAAWVANRDDATVTRIDTSDNKVTDTVAVGEGPRDVAVGLGSVWVTSLEAAEVARLDPVDGTVLDTISFDGAPQAVTTAAGLVWVTDRADSTVAALDPTTLEQVDEIAVGADPSAIVADGDAFVWVTNRADGTISKIDVGQRTVVGTFDVGELPGEAAVDGNSVWLASEGTSSLLRLDKGSGEVADTLDLGVRVEGVAIDDNGNPWVDGLSTLIQVDPDAVAVAGEVEVGGELREVAAGDGSVWTVPHDGEVLTRVDPS